MDNPQNVSSDVKFLKTNNMANAEGHFWNAKQLLCNISKVLYFRDQFQKR